MKPSSRSKPRSSEAVGLVRRLAEFGPAYMRWIGRNLPGDGTSAPRLRLLAALLEQGPMSMRALTQALTVSAQNVSVMVEGLEAQGMVHRRDHPEDRRVVVVELTPQGRGVVSAGMTAHQAAASAIFACMSADEQAAFAQTLDKLLDELRRQS